MESCPSGRRSTIGNRVGGQRRLKGSNPLLSATLNTSGPLVKWLRHRPFTAVTRVRIPYGSPFFFGQHAKKQKGLHRSFLKESMLNTQRSVAMCTCTFKGKEGMLRSQHPVATHALVRPVLRRISSAGRASALQAEGRRFDPVILHHFYENHIIAGWSSSVARRAHNPKVAGSNPAPATKLNSLPKWSGSSVG